MDLKAGVEVRFEHPDYLSVGHKNARVKTGVMAYGFLNEEGERPPSFSMLVLAHMPVLLTPPIVSLHSYSRPPLLPCQTQLLGG